MLLCTDLAAITTPAALMETTLLLLDHCHFLLVARKANLVRERGEKKGRMNGKKVVLKICVTEVYSEEILL